MAILFLRRISISIITSVTVWGLVLTVNFHRIRLILYVYVFGIVIWLA